MLGAIAADRRLHAGLGGGDADVTRTALKAAFARVDADLLALQETCECEPAPARGEPSRGQHGGLAAPSPPSASSSAPGQPVCHDGTTALVTVQLGGLLAVANAGDSRAVLCREGQAVRLSRDHTPALRSERERIEAAGGQVVTARGAARVLAPAVQGASTVKALSVSRSLGDPDFKVRQARGGGGRACGLARVGSREWVKFCLLISKRLCIDIPRSIRDESDCCGEVAERSKALVSGTTRVNSGEATSPKGREFKSHPRQLLCARAVAGLFIPIYERLPPCATLVY